MSMCIILHREYNLAVKNESLHQIQTRAHFLIDARSII